MTAVLIGKSKLKIKLDPFEAAKLFKNADNISCQDPETRYILKIILGRAISKTAFRLDCDRLKVELFPAASGGCIIYFTKSPERKRYKRNLDAEFKFLMEFSDSNKAVAASKTFYKNLRNIKNSRLYKFGKKYYLIVSSNSGYPLSLPLIKEFADSLQCSDTAAAIVSEYGNLMISENAIEKLAKI